MTIENETEESVPYTSLPEWPLYVQHYEELEKAQLRIGKTPLKTMQWATAIMELNDQKLDKLSKGDFENLAYEIAVFALLGTRRLPRIKAGKTFFGGPQDWDDKRGLGESIPSIRNVKTLVVELKRLVENLLRFRHTIFTVHETQFELGLGYDRGYLQSFTGRVQDRFLLHIANLLADFGARLRRCEADDCPRIYVSVRKKQRFCSTTCQSRIATRGLRHEKRKEVGTSDTRHRKNDRPVSKNTKEIRHGKTRR